MITLPPEPAAYRPRTAAQMIGLSRPYISAEIKAGRLKAQRIGGTVVIPRSALQEWITERAVPWTPK